MKNIVIKWAVFLTAFLISLEVSAQNVRVSGVVTDALGPIPGVNIMEEGTTNGTVTDVNGKYSISVSAKSTLVFSCIGYKEQKIRVGTKTVLNVNMVEESKMLDELVVVGYGVQRKSDVATSVASVKADEMRTFPAGNVADMLRGRAAGVNVTSSSGRPGSTPSITIRGSRSISADNAPLYIIDGSPSSATEFSTLSADDIESVEILKDAASQAIYGARASDGVVLVTTKRGKEGKAKISANTSMSVIVPTDPIKLANAYEYASYYNMQKLNDGAATAPFSDQILQKFKDHSDPLRFPDTDWIDYCFKDHAIQTQHNVNISGGTDRMRYFVSVGAFTQDGLFKQQSLPYDFNFKYQRFNYRANLDFDVTKTTTISVNLGGRVDTKNTPYSGEDNNQLFRQLYWATPFSSPGVINGKYLLSGTDYNDCDNMPFTGTTGLASYYGKGYMSRNSNTLNADVVLNQKLDVITKGLSFKLKGSYNSSYSVTKSRGASAAYYTPVMQPDGTVEYRKNGTDSQLG